VSALFLRAGILAVAGAPLRFSDRTMRAAASGRPTQVSQLKGSAKSVVIPTHEFYGNLDERLDFPADWDVNVMNMKGHGAPVLTEPQIARDLARPVGKPRCGKLPPAERPW